MRSVRNLYLIVSAVVAISLLGGLAQWLDSGAEEGGRFAGYMQRIPVASACHVVGAVGVIWLGWYWIRLARAITSIAKRLKADDIMDSRFRANDKPKANGNAIIDELSELLTEALVRYSNVIGQLEKQVSDLQIQIQLKQRQKGNIEAIIYGIRDAVIVVDEYDKLLMANEAAGRLFNFDFTRSQHKPVGELVEQDKSEFVDILSRSRQSKAQATKKEIEFLKDEETKTYDCIIS